MRRRPGVTDLVKPLGRPSLAEKFFQAQGKIAEAQVLESGRKVDAGIERRLVIDDTLPSKYNAQLGDFKVTKGRVALRAMMEAVWEHARESTGRDPLDVLLEKHPMEFFRILGCLQPKEVMVDQVIQHVVVQIGDAKPPEGWHPPVLVAEGDNVSAQIARQAALEADDGDCDGLEVDS